MADIFTLKMECENSAFEDQRVEIARILRAIADKIEQGEDYTFFTTIFDRNGNSVGRYAVKPHTYFD